MAAGPPLTVSVITPSLNQGRFLGLTLQSVATQDYPALEHWVIDGASSDQSLDVLRAAARPGLSWVSERDRGQAHAVNKGIARSSGDIIAWINSDDVYCPGALGAAARFLAAHPQVDVLYGLADHIDEQGALLSAYPTQPFELGRLHEFCFLCQPATFFRRSCIARFGLLDERLHYCMDYEYWLRLGRSGAVFAYLSVKLAGSRLHADTKTLGARVAVHREIIDMFLRLQGRVPANWLLGYAGAVVGQRVERQRHPWWFAAGTLAATLIAALRWNRGISAALLAALGKRWAELRSDTSRG
jgi:glycosyltransferase involved in cell wall biosynthesis